MTPASVAFVVLILTYVGAMMNQDVVDRGYDTWLEGRMARDAARLRVELAAVRAELARRDVEPVHCDRCAVRALDLSSFRDAVPAKPASLVNAEHLAGFPADAGNGADTLTDALDQADREAGDR